MNLGGIGVVKTDSQISLTAHRLKTVALSIPRGAFIGLLRLNVWGLASLIKKRAFEVDKATTDKQKMGEYWWDVQAKWRNAWWNLGGTWDKFVSAVNKGASKKPLAYAIAPKKIKDSLKAQGIKGLQGIGVVDPGTVTLITSAGVIITAVMPLIMFLVSKTKETLPPEDIEYIFEDELNSGDGSGDGDGLKFDMKTAGFGLLGVGVLAMLFMGDKKKKKK
tara:strand:+ start:452 stop:1111 length:660 start_codon:yes stop_codon:yes gene_type:complete